MRRELDQKFEQLKGLLKDDNYWLCTAFVIEWLTGKSAWIGALSDSQLKQTVQRDDAADIIDGWSLVYADKQGAIQTLVPPMPKPPKVIEWGPLFS